MRLTLFFLLAALLCNVQTAIAADLDSKSSWQLRLLELKYFEHTYEGNTPEERVERLEKLVIGDSVPGDPGKRIKTIATFIESSGESIVTRNLVQQNADGAASVQIPPETGDVMLASCKQLDETEQYPQIVRLEKAILRQTFDGLSLSERLARMELKAFGSSSNSNDLRNRIERLDAYDEEIRLNTPLACDPDADEPYVVPISRQSFHTGGEHSEHCIEHFLGISRKHPADTHNSAHESTALDSAADLQKQRASSVSADESADRESSSDKS